MIQSIACYAAIYAGGRGLSSNYRRDCIPQE